MKAEEGERKKERKKEKKKERKKDRQTNKHKKFFCLVSPSTSFSLPICVVEMFTSHTHTQTHTHTHTHSHTHTHTHTHTHSSSPASLAPWMYLKSFQKALLMATSMKKDSESADTHLEVS